MTQIETPEMSLRVELFVNAMSKAVDFYSQVLGFSYPSQAFAGYLPLTNGRVTIGLNLRTNLPDDHPVQARPQERLGRGVELVLEVQDISAMYEHVVASNWPLDDHLQRRPWGLSDFRVIDPDGYYWRITSRTAS